MTPFYYEDMSLKEIVQVLRLPEGTVKSQLNRARKCLREPLEEDELTTSDADAVFTLNGMGYEISALGHNREQVATVLKEVLDGFQ